MKALYTVFYIFKKLDLIKDITFGICVCKKIFGYSLILH